MLGSISQWVGTHFFGSIAIFALIIIFLLVFRASWKHREQRRADRERGRQRASFWGWE
jgi:hypothetical protein